MEVVGERVMDQIVVSDRLDSLLCGEIDPETKQTMEVGHIR